ncbi:MAG: signal peptide peptidase SppA [Cyclobacteriaceae bacterium]|nr:signal peptide peptidase SppA [Cyclobacteriaceae bacterium]MCB0498060.1 signal peptide peptidase SppA [Cyclobacteriaceae bacterium]MCB9238784.1 signal peptide peptidase SppA [Flammeovirgaceae bacterium]MCO5270503.1 signal peptide peptidase SppA [Cyclobacteriaceae bacterium]MCW5901056.1 signal peptide peptidase SppA [Cyclobacteriaceae bacterium]
MGFFKNFFASCLGSLVAILLAFLLGGMVFSYIISSGSKVTVGEGTVLYLDLEAPIVEQAVEDPLNQIIPGGLQPIGLLQLKEAIASAKADAKVKGIYLNTGSLLAGMATIEEVRQSLMDFKSSGKWVVAYAPAYTEGAYYLASVADKVYMNPSGQLELNGLSVDVVFYKGLLDKLEIKPQVFRVGDFKSAVEPFIRQDLSDENRLQLNAMVNGIYDEMLTKISGPRKIPKERLRELSDKMAVRTAGEAVSYGLVDSLYYEDQVRAEIRGRLGLGEDEDIAFMRYNTYRKSMPPSTSRNEIAVIIADGEIMPGKAENGVVGSATIVKELRKARANDRVKAIVMRINSPGGVYQAGDEMWREIVLATKEKPVIASMSDLAASGGYYMAMACDTIVAQPTTITGSIGVFSVIFDLSGFLQNKLGVTTDEVKTGEVGGLTVTRPLSDLEKAIWQKQTDEVYEIFTRKAAEGRHMAQDEIKKIASGRVWTGAQAKGNGLVDVLGGYNDAVELAAAKAHISGDYRTRYYPQPKSFLEQLTSDWEGEIKSRVLKNGMDEAYPFYQKWEKVKRYQGVQARVPYELKVR